MFKYFLIFPFVFPDCQAKFSSKVTYTRTHYVEKGPQYGFSGEDHVTLEIVLFGGIYTEKFVSGLGDFLIDSFVNYSNEHFIEEMRKGNTDGAS